MELKALVLTLLVGVFFLIGMIIPKFFKNKTKLISFSTGLTFVIILFLILVDIAPEIWELLEPNKNWRYLILIIIFTALGFVLLKILDYFVPEHSHHHKENETNIEEHNNHLFHIGFITALSLTIHNVLEGITIYVTGLTDFKMGIILAISVGCHNLPLGIDVAANMESNKEKKSMNIIISLLLIFSSFLGAFILFLMNQELNILVEGILLSLTLGMLIYITFCELWNEVKENFRKKEVQIGLIIGLIISIILLII